jgi:5'-deoxynucleotidase YfbR-like HD superfamily hydrolase
VIENHRQYLVTYREAQKFRAALGEAGEGPADGTLAAGLLRACREQLADLERDLRAYEQANDRGRVGDWMPTYAGRRFWLLDPRPEDIDIEDIAQALSRISRYNGMTSGPGYTVAQHSVLASRVLTVYHHRLAVLLHDAPEAYAGDVITPLKRLLGAAYEEIEDGIMKAVAARYGFCWATPSVEAVKHADKVMLATEIRDLLPLHVLRSHPGVSPLPGKIEPWPQEHARKMFLARFRRLTEGRR